jgi:hypothetical protein
MIGTACADLRTAPVTGDDGEAGEADTIGNDSDDRRPGRPSARCPLAPPAKAAPFRLPFGLWQGLRVSHPFASWPSRSSFRTKTTAGVSPGYM